MGLLLTGGAVFTGSGFHPLDLIVNDGRIVSISPFLPREGHTVIELNGRSVVPGFVDVHVHLREPGFSYKETIATGTAAAAAGGYTAVCSMPNLSPVPDTMANLQAQLTLIEQSAAVRVYPYGAITKGESGEELADMEAMAPFVAGFSDDGRGVQSEAMMEQAMMLAKKLDKPIVAHCEDNALLGGKNIHAGRWAAAHGMVGISSESEWKQIERDIALVEKTGCRYHVCHISTKESVALIRAAKAKGLPVTCETAPHYLVLCEDDLQDHGYFKMNPPLRSAADRDALAAGLLDGTIDCIATDHAPHDMGEKSSGLVSSAMGVVGLETAFPVLYTKLVKPGILPMETLIDRLCVRPREIFGLRGGKIEAGAVADLTVLDLEREDIVSPAFFHSKGRATPFAGLETVGAVALTICGGNVVHEELESRSSSVKMDSLPTSDDAPSVFSPACIRCAPALRVENPRQQMVRSCGMRRLTQDVWELAYSCDTSAITMPGQFVNLSIPGFFLRRPISVCDWSDDSLILLVREAGEGTKSLLYSQHHGDSDMLLGLGNGFDASRCTGKPILIGGGIGTAPLYGLARRMAEAGTTPTVALGFNTLADAIYVEKFKHLGCEVLIATMDGSLGVKGFVTAAVESTDCDYAFVCGPTPMLKAVYALPQLTGGQFSFEERMGCGFGACVGCTIQTKNGPRQVCKDGPIFHKEEIVW